MSYSLFLVFLWEEVVVWKSIVEIKINFTKRKIIMFHPSEKVALFIDGANLYATAKTLGFDIDYKRLLTDFENKCNLLRAYYYTALMDDQEYSSIRPLIDWLNYNGYSVVTKPVKEFHDAEGRRKIKGNMDIELAVDAMEVMDHIDHMVLFSGDGDFRSLVEAIQRKGRKVTVISTLQTKPPMIADDLRRQADYFIDLATLGDSIGRAPLERPQQGGQSDFREHMEYAPQDSTPVNASDSQPVAPVTEAPTTANSDEPVQKSESPPQDSGSQAPVAENQPSESESQSEGNSNKARGFFAKLRG